MKTVLIIAGILVALLLVAVILLARSHKQWLERQSPAGVWRSVNGRDRITLQFDGGPHEGLYKQLAESGGKQIKEFGHWAVRANALKMIILATEVEHHPRFGVDTNYTISYVGPTSIKIDGPDLSGIVFEKVPDGAILDFEQKVEPIE